MENKKVDYEFVQGVASDEELEQYKRCFAENDSIKVTENLKWFHQDNIAGANAIYYAVHNPDKQIAGICAGLTANFNYQGKKVKALQALDVLTDKNHRGKGLFLSLEKKIFQHAQENNFELVYAIPNENSIHVFEKKLNCKVFGQMPFLIKPLRFSYIINKFIKKSSGKSEDSNCTMQIPDEVTSSAAQKIKVIHDFGAEYDQFWKQVKPLVQICIDRNAEYMNWRYVQKPNEIYYKYGLFEDEKLKAIVVFTLKNKHGGKTAYIMELLYLPGYDKAGAKLLQFASKYLKKNEADIVLAWCLKHSFNFKAYSKASFFRFPEKIRPQKLFFIAKPVDSANANVLNENLWYLSYSDSDTV